MKQLLVVMVLVAACSKGKGGDKAGTDECAAAIDHMMSTQLADMPKDMPEDQKKKIGEMMKKVSSSIAASCRDTKWSKEAIACIKNVKNMDDGKACEDKLTAAQKEAADKAAETASKEAEAAADKPPEGGAPSTAEQVAALKGITELKDKMCACKDAACGDEVYKLWGDVEKASESARHDDRTKAAWNAIDDEFMKCKGNLK